MYQEFFSNDSQGYGDSPTVKSYTDWSFYKSVFNKFLRGELSFVEEYSLKTQGNIFLKESIKARFYEAYSPLSRLHKSLNNNARLLVFQGGEALVKLDAGEGKGVATSNIIIDVAANGTIIIESKNRVGGELSLLGLNIIVRSGVKGNIMVNLEDSLESVSGLNFILESEKSSNINLVFLVNPGKMSRIEGLVKPGSDSVLKVGLSGILREGCRLDAVVDGLVSNTRSTLNLISTVYLKNNAMGSVRGRGVVSPNAEDARIVYGLETILEENAVGFMQPYLEVYSNKVIEARHYAKNYMITYDKLFYLTSRGLSVEEARRLVLTGLLTSSTPLGLKKYSYEKIISRL